MTTEEKKAKELDELFQFEEDLTDAIGDDNLVAKKILDHLRELKEYFNSL